MKSKFLIKITSIGLLVISCSVARAQVPSGVWEKTVSYDKKTKTLYQFADEVNIQEIPSAEMIMMNPSERMEHHNEYYSSSLKYFHETTIVKDTDYPDWMEVPAKRIVNLEGIFLYNEVGALIKYQPYDTLFPLEDYQYQDNIAMNEGPFPLPNISIFNQTYLDELQQNGYSVYEENGLINMTINNTKRIINIENLHFTYIEYDELNNEKIRVESTYFRDEFGRLNPKEEIEIQFNKTSNNIDFKKIYYTEYSLFSRGGSDNTYNIPVIEPLTTRNQLFGDAIVVYPNPSSAIAFVSLPNPTSDDNKNVEVRLKTLNGVTLETKNAQAGTTIEIDVSNLNIGSHIISVSWRDYTKNIHFLKY